MIQLCYLLKGGGGTMQRRNFANHMVEKLENGSNSAHKILFSDETHFQLNGYLNKQNWRHLDKENLHLNVVFHAQRIMVCYVIPLKRITGPVFIDGMVTGVKYRELLEHHFDPEMGRRNMTSRYWFMQDGARPNRTADIFTCLETTFGECLIVHWLWCCTG